MTPHADTSGRVIPKTGKQGKANSKKEGGKTISWRTQKGELDPFHAKPPKR
jgi:hypothetical protein